MINSSIYYIVRFFHKVLFFKIDILDKYRRMESEWKQNGSRMSRMEAESSARVDNL
jgi:hypothetical protein